MLKIVPRDETFFDQIEQLSSLSKTSVDQLNELFERYPSKNVVGDHIVQSREEAAKVMQSTLCRLDDAFITPLDREDIMQLITDLFDVIDKVADVTQRLSLYGVKEMYPGLRAQAASLQKITNLLVGVLADLRHEKKLRELSPRLEEVQALEKKSAQDRDKFLGELFQGNPNALDVLKKKELHDMLEGAIWNCEDVARTLGRVLLKNG